jgi:hypothetical protein
MTENHFGEELVEAALLQEVREIKEKNRDIRKA